MYDCVFKIIIVVVSKVNILIIFKATTKLASDMAWPTDKFQSHFS